MKKSILYTILLLCTYILQAQSPVLGLYAPDTGYGNINNAYYKDITNFQNQFEGTWLYTNGTTSLKITMVKKPMFYNTGPINFYEDLLVGEYQYIENGVEKVNTLANLNVNHTEYLNYNLYSSGQVRKGSYAVCYECINNEFRIMMRLNEPSRRNYGGLSNKFVIRHFTENGIEKIKVWFIKTGLTYAYTDSGDTTIKDYSLPYGIYVLTKQ